MTMLLPGRSNRVVEAGPLLTACLFLVLSLMIAGCDQEGAGDIGANGLEEVRVDYVVDGDTVKLSDGRTVRYIGVDTPEIAHGRGDDDCYGPEASVFNRQLVEGQLVFLEYDENRLDRYGRTLAYVWIGSGSGRRMVSQELLFRGYGKVMMIQPNTLYETMLEEAEESARKRGAGLWGACQSGL